MPNSPYANSSDSDDMPPALNPHDVEDDELFQSNQSPPIEPHRRSSTASKKSLTSSRKKQIALFIACLISLGIILLIIVAFIMYLIRTSSEQKCLSRPLNPIEKEDAGQDPRPLRNKGSVLIKNVNILTGAHPKWDKNEPVLMEHVDILVKDGKIVQVGEGISSTSVDKVYSMDGHICTPGIVDLHSHLGVYAFPELSARSDGNEISGPVVPQMRAIDAIFPSDPAIEETMRGGVTTAQVLPGSANNMGGEAVLIKLRGASVSELRVRNGPRVLKFACGENPKRVWGGYNRQLPVSRMGNAWVMRQIFEKAQKLKLAQDAWDCNPENIGEDPWKRPSDLALDPLVALLRGDALLNTHCYEVEDLEMMIRLSKEFDFKIAAFHHAMSAWLIPDVIRENNITIATFADLFGYKEEAFDSSVHQPHILDDAGVKVAMKSDHPVTHSKDLVTQAARAFYYGFKEESAIASLTSIPAKTLKMEDTIGAIRSGLDADIVLWDRHPLELGARPVSVFIEGKLVYESGRPLRDTKTRLTKDVQPSLSFEGTCESKGFTKFSTYAVKNAKVYTMDDAKTVKDNQMIVVKDGMIICMDAEATCSTHLTTGAPVFEVKDGETIVTPGPIEATTPLGLFEIEAESSTGDGYSKASSLSVQSKVKAANGIHLQSRAVQAAWAGGVTTAITPPLAGWMVQGMSVAYNTAGDFLSNSLVSESVALHIVLGHEAKVSGSLSASISGQFTELETLFASANASSDTSDPFARVMRREIPLAVRAYDGDVISHLLRLKRRYNFDLIVIGAAEAHLLADELKALDVSVIVTPNEEGKVATQQYQTLRSDDTYGAETLYKAGVRVGVGMGSIYNTRNLRWQAGLVADSGVVPLVDGIAMMTRNIADMFGLSSQGLGQVKVNTRANFAVFSGNPLTYDGRVMLAVAGDKVTCTPEQF